MVVAACQLHRNFHSLAVGGMEWMNCVMAATFYPLPAPVPAANVLSSVVPRKGRRTSSPATAGPLLPHARLCDGRRGRGAGDVASCLPVSRQREGRRAVAWLRTPDSKVCLWCGSHHRPKHFNEGTYTAVTDCDSDLRDRFPLGQHLKGSEQPRLLSPTAK